MSRKELFVVHARRRQIPLYHVHAEPGAEGRTWARSIELQIQERDVGDLYAVGSEISVRSTPREVGDHVVFDYDPKGESRVFSQVPGKQGRCVKQPDNEKSSGEWNTVELVCLGEHSIHIVNGKVVMRRTHHAGSTGLNHFPSPRDPSFCSRKEPRFSIGI